MPGSKKIELFARNNNLLNYLNINFSIFFLGDLDGSL